jgi:hypothetical protein
MFFKDTFAKSCALAIKEHVDEVYGIDCDILDIMDIIGCEARYLSDNISAQDAFYDTIDDCDGEAYDS